jgi:ubiquinone/menaquinone biosynthesis C-methylase UbiE
MMSTIASRYDRNAEDYERYWAPVLDESARRLLDRIEPFMTRQGGQARILDVGTGSGVLALEALFRWPAARLVGADASSGMLGMARVRAAQAGRPTDDPNLRWVHAPADRLALEDGSVDAVVSSFVYQLVPDRSAAFREAHRVLRPGGRIALVTWLDRDGDFEPSVEFDEAVYDLDIEEPEEEPEEVCAGDLRGARSAANELRRAGFARVSARIEPLEYRWTRETYLAFKEHYDERALFSWLDRQTADRLLQRARERFAALPDGAFTWRTELVSALGERP